MRTPPLRLTLSFLIFAGISFGTPKWLPIDPAEFQTTQSPIDPDAGAETLYREVTIDGSAFNETQVVSYFRVRVYSDRGVEDLSKIELPYRRNSAIRSIEARTIKPDGTILELNRKDVYDREVLKAGKTRVKVKAFAPPGLEKGAIVEYRFRQVIDEPSYFFVLQFQSKLPTRHVRYKVHLLSGVDLGVRALFFRCPTLPLKPDRDGAYEFQLTNVPAWKEEPFQPPEIHFRPSAILYYTEPGKQPEPDVYWREKGKKLHRESEKAAKVTRQVRAAAESIVAPDDTPDEKLRKLYDYCRTKIVNRRHPPAGQPRDPAKKYPKNDDATDTLGNGSGTPGDINALFAALARAAGFEARFAHCNDRNVILFSRTVAVPFALNDFVVAIRQGEGWGYYSPGEPFLPPGMLAWNNTGTTVLVADPKELRLEQVDGSEAEASTRKRSATFLLDADGTLEGDVTVTYTGHWDAEMKSEVAGDTAEDHADFVKNEIQSTLKLAEVSDVVIEHAADSHEPMRVSYHLRVPEFAERTGSRLFIQPAVFQKNESALFTAATRAMDVIFRYRYVEADEIKITPPEGFTLEAGSAPQSLEVTGVGSYHVSIGVTRQTQTLVYTRRLAVDTLFLSAKAYDPLKRAFDSIHSRDNHVLTLKRVPAAAAATAPAMATEPAGASATH